MTLNNNTNFEEICNQLEKDLGAPICKDLAKKFEKDPGSKAYFESIKRVVGLYQDYQSKACVSSEMKKRLLNKIKKEY